MLLSVRMSIVSISTGRYLDKSDPARPVVSAHDTKTPYILPIMTKPFDVKKKRSLEPMFNEDLVVNEDYAHLLQPDAMLLFELVDLDAALSPT